ncbi:hypothetical protein PIB30_082152 [Stylosanthes scabra]|uniref:Uncharacterized protein n=1 Tax=Stylosanthes scabra TaxID=79078 RepID=A0ABU6UT31_9FABA|nr:hypothetical protein [Stylosanthes scabra]
MQGATLKNSGVGSAWMHAGQGDFPRICVGLLRLCVGLKLVGESGLRLSMSKRELEHDLGCLGVDGSLLSTHMHPLPRICVELFLRFASKLRFLLCVPTPRRGMSRLGIGWLSGRMLGEGVLWLGIGWGWLGGA